MEHRNHLKTRLISLATGALAILGESYLQTLLSNPDMDIRAMSISIGQIILWIVFASSMLYWIYNEIKWYIEAIVNEQKQTNEADHEGFTLALICLGAQRDFRFSNRVVFHSKGFIETNYVDNPIDESEYFTAEIAYVKSVIENLYPNITVAKLKETILYAYPYHFTNEPNRTT